jgi:hypothetical protein
MSRAVINPWQLRRRPRHGPRILAWHDVPVNLIAPSCPQLIQTPAQVQRLREGAQNGGGSRAGEGVVQSAWLGIQ